MEIKTAEEITRDLIRGSIYGVLAGDALGLPVQFEERDRVREHPVTGMRGYGAFNLPAGSWSDDGSLTLASLDALSGGFSPDAMMRCFQNWLRDGAYTQYGYSYDVGNACWKAITRYCGGTPAEECGCRGQRENGNGSLMRLMPTVLYQLSRFGTSPENLDEYLTDVHRSSALTHAHPISQICCGTYALLASGIVEERLHPTGLGLKEILSRQMKLSTAYYGCHPLFREHPAALARLQDFAAFSTLPEEDIRSTGYVVDTLEAALWCLANTGSFPECLLRAVNLGLDSDTVGAVTGGLAGLWYGEGAIPAEWLEVMPHRDIPENLLRQFCDARRPR